jgi:hypothetical protein
LSVAGSSGAIETRVLVTILALLAADTSVMAAAHASQLPSGRVSRTEGAKLSHDDMTAIAKQVRRCFELTPDEFNSGYVVSITVNLNRGGGVAADPILNTPTHSQLQRDVARAVVRAVRACAPYRLPPGAYDDWKQMEMTFKP